MSICSKLRKSKNAAKMHKKIASDQIKAEAIPKPPYKHVPTHAFFDALTSGPWGWKQGDRDGMMEQRIELRNLTSNDPSLSPKRENGIHGQSLV
jgi:hypothetical protein